MSVPNTSSEILTYWKTSLTTNNSYLRAYHQHLQLYEVHPKKQFISPTVLQPFPTVVSEPGKRRQRKKKKKTEIITSTPILQRLEEKEKLKVARKSGSKNSPV